MFTFQFAGSILLGGSPHLVSGSCYNPTYEYWGEPPTVVLCCWAQPIVHQTHRSAVFPLASVIFLEWLAKNGIPIRDDDDDENTPQYLKGSTTPYYHQPSGAHLVLSHIVLFGFVGCVGFNYNILQSYVGHQQSPKLRILPSFCTHQFGEPSVNECISAFPFRWSLHSNAFNALQYNIYIHSIYIYTVYIYNIILQNNPFVFFGGVPLIGPPCGSSHRNRFEWSWGSFPR
jgi:hypothetical protein